MDNILCVSFGDTASLIADATRCCSEFRFSMASSPEDARRLLREEDTEFACIVTGGSWEGRPIWTYLIDPPGAISMPAVIVIDTQPDSRPRLGTLQASVIVFLPSSVSADSLVQRIGDAVRYFRDRRAVRVLGARLTERPDVKATAASVCEALQQLVGWSKITIALITEQVNPITQQTSHVRSILVHEGYGTRQISAHLLRALEEDPVIKPIVERKIPAVWPDLATEAPSSWELVLQTQDIKSWIAIPLYMRSRPLGVITLDHTERNHYLQASRVALQNLADVAAEGIDNALHTRNRNVVEEILRTISRQSDRLQVLRTFVDALHSHTDADRCAVFNSIPDADADAIELLLDERGPVSEPQHHRMTSGLAVWALRHGQTRFASNTATEPDFHKFANPKSNPVSMIAVPIRTDNRSIGVVTLGSRKPARFSGYDVALVERVVPHVAAAVERLRITELLSGASIQLSRQALLASPSRAGDLRATRSMLESIVRSAVQLVHAHSGVIHRVRTDSSSKPHIVTSYAFPPRFNHPQPRMEGDSLLKELIDGASEVHCTASRGNTSKMNPGLAAKGIKSVIGVRLIAGDEFLGGLLLNGLRGDDFGDAELSVLRLFAAQASTALRSADMLDANTTYRALGLASQAVLANNDIGATLQSIAQQALALTRGSYAHVGILVDGAEGQQIEFSGAWPQHDLRELKESVEPLYVKSGSAKQGGRKGLVGLCAWREDTVILKDIRAMRARSDRGEREMQETEEQRNYISYKSGVDVELVVPIRGEQNKMLGVLNVEYSDADDFTQEDVDLANVFASHASLAIEKNGLIDQARQRSLHLETIGKIEELIMTSADGDLSSAMNKILYLMAGALRTQAVVVIRLGSVTGQAEEGVTEFFSTSRSHSKDTLIRSGDRSISRQVFRSNLHRTFPIVRESPEVNPALEREGVGAAVCMPLRWRSTSIGVVWLEWQGTREGGFNRIELEIFEMYANALGIAYETTREAQSQRAQLRSIERDITANIDKDYAQTRKHSDVFFGISVIACGVGLVALFVGVSGPDVKGIPIVIGSISEIVAGLVFSRFRDATRRMDEYHTERLQIRQLAILVETASKIDAARDGMRSQLQACAAATRCWFGRQQQKEMGRRKGRRGRSATKDGKVPGGTSPPSAA